MRPLDSTREQVEACVEMSARAGLDFLVLDQTRPDVGVPVVRVIVPGLRHFYAASRPAGCTMFRSSWACATSRSGKAS